MRGFLATAGERVLFECSLPWVNELIAEGAGGELSPGEAPGVSLRIHVEADRRPFETHGWELLSRGAWRRQGEVVVENACTSGFDLHLRQTADHAELTYRWGPPARERAAARVLRSRFHLLARAVLMQYPVLWWAGTRGRAPLHASGYAAGASTPLVTAQSGVGRSTLLLSELTSGGQATGDNLAVGDGKTVWGLVEPIRVEGGSGRRMPHGRHETWAARSHVRFGLQRRKSGPIARDEYIHGGRAAPLLGVRGDPRSWHRPRSRPPADYRGRVGVRDQAVLLLARARPQA